MDTRAVVQVVIALWTCITITENDAANVTSSTSSTDTPAPADLDDIPKAGITIVVLGVILIIAIVIAKLATMCYERGEIRDDASDISEHTRDLLKAKLTVAKFKSILSKSKKTVDREKLRQDASRKYAKIWISNARKKRKARAEAVTLKWTSQTSRASIVVPPIDVKPIAVNDTVNDPPSGSNDAVKIHQSQKDKVPPPIEVKVVNEVEKTNQKSKAKPAEAKTKFPAAPQKQAAIPAPSPDDPKSDILDSPKKQDGANPPPGGTVTPKNIAVEVDNKPITAKSQAMRPVSAKPKLIRPSSAERETTAKSGAAKRPPTAKKKKVPTATLR